MKGFVGTKRVSAVTKSLETWWHPHWELCFVSWIPCSTMQRRASIPILAPFCLPPPAILRASSRHSSCSASPFPLPWSRAKQLVEIRRQPSPLRRPRWMQIGHRWMCECCSACVNAAFLNSEADQFVTWVLACLKFELLPSARVSAGISIVLSSRIAHLSV
jgi:hypothetical protein